MPPGRSSFFDPIDYGNTQIAGDVVAYRNMSQAIGLKNVSGLQSFIFPCTGAARRMGLQYILDTVVLAIL